MMEKNIKDYCEKHGIEPETLIEFYQQGLQKLNKMQADVWKEKDETIESLRKENEELNQAILRRNGMLQDKDQTISELQSEVERLKNELGNTVIMLNDAMREVDRLNHIDERF